MKYDAVVVGGGIAGTSIAYHLSRHNLKTLLVERERELALHASGNPMGIASIYLTKHKSFESDWSLECHLELRSLLEGSEMNLLTKKKGIHFYLNSENKSRYLTAAERLPIDLVTYKKDEFEREWLFFPRSYSFSPREFCQYLVQLSPNLTLAKSVTFENFEIQNGIVKVKTNSNTIETELLFLAKGEDMQKSFPFLPFQKVKGQILILPFEAPETYLFGKYLAPIPGKGSILGASYREFDDSLNISENDSVELLEALYETFPEFKEKSDLKWSARVAFRMQMNDRRPIAGFAPKQDNYLESMDQIILFGGLGSRGLNLAFGTAKHLVSYVLGKSLLPRELMPNRFGSKKKKSSLGTIPQNLG